MFFDITKPSQILGSLIRVNHISARLFESITYLIHGNLDSKPRILDSDLWLLKPDIQTHGSDVLNQTLEQSKNFARKLSITLLCEFLYDSRFFCIIVKLSLAFKKEMSSTELLLR